MLNMSIISENAKIIEIVKISNLNKTNFSSNENIKLDWSNYIVNIKTNVESFSLNNFFSNLSVVQKDFAFLMVIVIVFITILGIISLIKISSRRL